MRIAVIGGTGYTGENIVREAASRGHVVTSFSRNLPSASIENVNYKTGDASDTAAVAEAVAGAEVIISTLSPRGALAESLRAVDAEIAQLAAKSGARLLVVGGFSSLRPANGEPRFAETGEIPEEYAAEARTMNDILGDLLAGATDGLEWTFFSPAQSYGSYAPGEALGKYRVGDEIAFFDEDGNSAISGADFALAIVDEAEAGQYKNAHISIAY
ncbi:NAD(P)-dependent oxidoreductase [Humidisolicoccus flavus]|uniref:NAD(P)-dependent oxidoreductase n=1 Tax=Humidisolicoccus flavus TaxID=3111414 RepID=UPI003255F010